ncbi:BgTH12-03162 [Blumeria graminis f. sp. triticale]|uniref:BgTH12-03162 n=1 Tax=Blumeria graminis f. sp. triticale TaxID=1689686 RepID=A0A9W4GFE4_BLUGR|nr:BgTH12-03162 [Blumeria graminis f. sp. triticale]
MNFSTNLKEHLNNKPLDKILKSFRALYYDNFDSPSEFVFENPKNGTEFQFIAKFLIKKFISYVEENSDRLDNARRFLSRLGRIHCCIDTTFFDIAPYEPIATLILNHATDLEVWNSLVQLADTLESLESATDAELNLQASNFICM